MCLQRTSSPTETDQNGKKARATAKSKKAVRDIGTCSLNKKQIGDHVKAALALNKYALNRTVISVSLHVNSILPN